MAEKNSETGDFTQHEKEAMKARKKELAAEKRANKKKADGEKALRDAIEAMSGSDKTMAQRIHTLVMEAAPDLWPKTWYGMPAYAKDGKVICFYQSAQKFEARYATFGFNDTANLDDGNMWPTSFALIQLTPNEEKLIMNLVKKAVSPV